MLTTRKKKKIVEEYALHEGDTGSAGVQIALLTKRIDELTTHLKKNKNDNHSRRGLLQMVGHRRRLLNYLARTDEKGYARVSKKLEIKK